MLTKQQKKDLVKDLTQEIEDSKSVVLCDYKGLTVADVTKLRRELKSVGSSLKVVKKTLTEIAIKNTGVEMNVKEMEGQVGIVCNKEDEVSGAKKLYDFSKENENLGILKGILEKKELSQEEVINLAKLPSKEELLAKVVGSVKAPVSGLVNVLGGNLRGLVGVLNAIKETK